MIRILEIKDEDSYIIVRGTLDGDDKSGNDYIMPISKLVPERIHKIKLSTALFEYRIDKITKI